MAKPIAGLTAAARAVGMKAGGYVPTGMIRWHLGSVHVSTSALTIARDYWHKRAAKFPRPIKRAVVRAAILQHLANRREYRDIMGARSPYLQSLANRSART